MKANMPPIFFPSSTKELPKSKNWGQRNKYSDKGLNLYFQRKPKLSLTPPPYIVILKISPVELNNCLSYNAIHLSRQFRTIATYVCALELPFDS